MSEPLSPTFGTIRDDCISLLMEFDGDAASDSPDVLDRNIRRATSEMARQTECFWHAQTIAMVDGQAQYCASGILKLKAFQYIYQTDSGDDTTQLHWPLAPSRSEDMDRRSRLWRDQSTDQRPSIAVIEGMNQFRVYRTPSIAAGASASVLAEGFADPTRCTAADGTTPLFFATSDAWPLPAFAADAVPFRVAMYRGFQFPGDKEKQGRMAMGNAEYRRVLVDLKAFAMSYRPPFRYGHNLLWRG